MNDQQPAPELHPDDDARPLSWLGDEERLDWLQLIRSDNVGPAAFRMLLDRTGSARAALDALPAMANRGGASRRIKISNRDDAEAEIRAANTLGIGLIGMDEPNYPPWLRQSDSAPPLLAVLGSTQSLAKPVISIVGSRNASAVGRKMAAILARDLGERGFTIASGLARGIDTSAHQASLQTGTIAVFAGGLDVIYPPENTDLVDQVLEHDGVLVGEMPLGWQPRARDFPRRNRIIAGLGLATIVVEAAERSGSLITARMALEQNREVMAVPGSPLDPRAAGANRLLKQGAVLVTEADDVISMLQPILGAGGIVSAPASRYRADPVSPAEEPLDSERQAIIEALGPSPIEVDEVVRLTGLHTRTVSISLLELELAGKLERHPGQRVSLT
jgi:DNA processing protein